MDRLKKSLLIVVTLLFVCRLFAQFASFSADTTRLKLEMRKDIHDQIMEAEWNINGQILHYGSKPILIKVDDKLDTILFRQRKHSKVDTIVCQINKAGNYKFYYNDCCGAFNLVDARGKIIRGSVRFRIRGQEPGLPYLGTMGESGILINKTTKDSLMPACRSAMSPNIYQLTMSQIEMCADTIECKEGTCLYDKEKEELNYSFGYKTIIKMIDFLYMPLSEQAMEVTYNLRNGKFQIK